MSTYQVIDSRTQQVVGSYKTPAEAFRLADRKDNEFGAARYLVKTIYA
jgi:hypothetical protein